MVAGSNISKKSYEKVQTRAKYWDKTSVNTRTQCLWILVQIMAKTPGSKLTKTAVNTGPNCSKNISEWWLKLVLKHQSILD